MTWWKRMLFSIISITGGWFSLDILFFALSRIRNFGEGGRTGGKVSDLFSGAALLIAFLIVFTIYFWLLKSLSGNLNIIEYGEKEEKPKVKSKWFDVFLQGGIFATGFFLHFMYLLLFYFPNLSN